MAALERLRVHSSEATGSLVGTFYLVPQAQLASDIISVQLGSNLGSVSGIASIQLNKGTRTWFLDAL